MRDQGLIMDDAAALTSSRVSTHTIPLGNLSSGNAERDIGGGDNQLYLEMEVNTTFQSSGSSTLAVSLQTDDADTFGSAATIPGCGQSGIAKAALVAGARFRWPLPPAAYEKYLRANYTVGTADFTAGALTCWIGDAMGSRYVSADSAQVNA